MSLKIVLIVKNVKRLEMIVYVQLLVGINKIIIYKLIFY